MARRDDDPGYDPRRREFFRAFGRQTVRNAGAVIGAASEIRRAGGDAARELFDLGSSAPVGSASALELAPPVPAAPGTSPSVPFRSAYGVVDDGLLLFDQRDLPARTNILKVQEPSEIASAIRLGVTNTGPVLAEICAYGLALATAGAADRSPQSGELTFRAAASTLVAVRREVRAIAYAVGRMASRYQELITAGRVDDAAELTTALRAEADAIATDNALGHAALGRTAAEHFVRRSLAGGQDSDEAPIDLLMHGDMGPLSCGLVGTGTAIVQALRSLGRDVHVWLTDVAPGMEGSRIAALQLMQADIPHTLISDSAVAWLVSSRRLDAVLIRGDYVCANGDTSSVIGSLNVAHLAASAGVPVLVVAPRSAIDLELPDGGTLTVQLRSPAENAPRTQVSGDSALTPMPFSGVRLNPTSDLVPAALIGGFLTEAGFRAEVPA
jgi:methylthioribose-1-phosphate isomerase